MLMCDVGLPICHLILAFAPLYRVAKGRFTLLHGRREYVYVEWYLAGHGENS